MNRTFILTTKAGEIAGPCIADDIVQEEGIEVMLEETFKWLHADKYRQHIIENIEDAVACWIESFYEEEKQLTFEFGAIFSDSFICHPTVTEVHLMFSASCLPSEAVLLVLHLKAHIPEEISITVTMLPADVGSLCEN